MAEDNAEASQKLKDLEQLLNNALNELNNPGVIQENESTDDASSFEHIDELNNLNDAFKNLMNPSNDNGFDQTMIETMKRLEENMKNMPQDADASEEEMAKIWSQMINQSENDDDFPPFFIEIMQKLLAKDVLYPPLKDLSDKYPDWLSENKDKLSDDEFTKYNKQYELIGKVCALYEENDTDGPIESVTFQKILTAMQEMQQCGQPPEGLVAGNQNANFQPTSMEDFNKLMEESANLDQCKTM